MTVEREAATILQVQAGTLTVTAAARQLGISRKTYYQKEARLLTGGLAALRRKQPGRPRQGKSPEQKRLEAENHRLRQQVELLEQRLHIQAIMAGAETRAKKK